MRNTMARFGKKTTLQARRRWMHLRPAVDALAALAFFTVVTCMAGSAPTAANPRLPPHAGIHFSPMAKTAVGDATEAPAIVEIATTSSPQAADAVYRRTSTTAAWLLLSFAFSLMIAFNLAVLRHMRRAYARKSPGRKG